MSLQTEIREQPEVVARISVESHAEIAAVAAVLAAPDIHHVLIAARGTSDNAARYAKYAWPAFGGIPVTLAAPSLFTLYHRPPDLTGAAIVAISQSGQSPDLLEVLTEGKRQQRPTIAITNDADSPLAEGADMVIALHAGPERAVAATKTYTATLTAVAAISAQMSEPAHRAELDALPAAVATVIEQAAEISEMAATFGDFSHAVVLGRGYNHSTAFEWSLKLQEMAYVLAHPFSTADFAHGPFALLEPAFPVLAVATRGAVLSDMTDMLARIDGERSARLLLVTNVGSLPYPSLTIPDIPDWLSPIPAIVAAQLFTAAAAVRRGIDPEKPRGLDKVTRTI